MRCMSRRAHRFGRYHDDDNEEDDDDDDDDDIYIMVKCLCVSKSHYFRFKRISSFLLFLDIFQIQKCIETVKRQNPLK